MSTFYLLPARPQLGRHFGQYLETLFPGLSWPRSVWNDLAEALGSQAHCHPEVYVVYREDLPETAKPPRPWSRILAPCREMRLSR